ncbi:large ribosomal subunit protein bL33m isoform X1 [Odocoileus virginianus]|uniref:Large ribosomal subunit protein bL33m n=1 Tax=Odocoileus virginianus TaxID=9874 RepID=A0ABM4GS01_ODOVR
MFLSAVTFAKSKSKTILVKMVSQAGTGFSFNTKRSRLWEKLTLLHYDPSCLVSGISELSLQVSFILMTKESKRRERRGLMSDVYFY